MTAGLGTTMVKQSHAVVMLGATGAVGGHAARALATMPEITRLVLIGRRPVDGLTGRHIEQHTADILDPANYAAHLAGLDTAVCTLGVGEPSKVTRDEFVRIDKRAALDFAIACKAAGVQHFSLLASVGAKAKSSNFYLRTKGELEDGLRQLGFARLSLFEPSMILTPTNRYGVSQAIVLAVWPIFGALLIGPARKYRGIDVGRLGRAMAHNIPRNHNGEEVLRWDQFMALSTD